MGPLQPWHDFFLLTGGASATLMGLVFVAASIAAAVPNERLGDDEDRALDVQPIIYAFLRVLLVSAFALIPTVELQGFGYLVASGSVIDLARMGWVFHALLRKRPLKFSRWRWHFIAPVAATTGALITGAALATGLSWSVLSIAICLLMHLTVGIHNAWELADSLAMASG